MATGQLGDFWDEQRGTSARGVRVGLVGRPASVSPLLDRGPEASEVEGALFRGLVGWNAAGAQVACWASRVPSVQDRTFRAFSSALAEYTFNVRDGARWSDDSPLTANDLLFSYRMAVHPSFRKAHLSWTSCLKQFDLPGPQALRLTVQRSSHHDVLDFYPLPAHLLDNVALDPVLFAQLPYHERPVGNGPFRMKSRSDRVLRLEANPSYLPHPAMLEEMRFICYDSVEQALAGMARGDIDVLSVPADIARMRLPVEVDLQATAGTRLLALVFNTRHPLTSHESVRKALARALDRAAVLKACTPGPGVASDSWLQPWHGAYHGVFAALGFDLAAARKELASCPWRIDGQGHFVSAGSTEVLSIAYDAEQADVQGVVLALRESWLGLGLSVGLVPLDHESYEDRLRRGDYCVALQELEVTPWTEPSLYFAKESIPDKRNGFRGSNVSGWTDPAQEKLLGEIGRAAAPAAAASALKEQQRILARHVPVLPLFFYARLTAVRMGLGGVRDRGYGELTWNVEAWHWK